MIALSASIPAAPTWTEAASAVADAVDTLARVPAADLADTQLAQAMAQMAVQASRLHALAVDLACEADIRRVWKMEGASSLRSWVRRCVQLADDATRVVTAARTRPLMPKMASLFSSGHVSLAQMGTAARQIRRLPDVPAWHRPAGDPSNGDRTCQHGSTGSGAAPGEPGPCQHGPSESGSCESGRCESGRCESGSCESGSCESGRCPADPAQCESASREGEAGWDGEVSSECETSRWGDLRSAADAILAERAPDADAKMLAALGEQIHAAADPGDHLGETLSRRERRQLSISRSFEGMGEVAGRLDPEATERAITVLNALSQPAGPDDERTAAQRRADAFDSMCRAWLESGRLPAPQDGTPRRDQIIVTIPYRTLLGIPGSPGAVLGDGTPITAATALRLACDASVRRVVLAHSSYGTCLCGHSCSWTAGPASAGRPYGPSDLDGAFDLRGPCEAATARHLGDVPRTSPADESTSGRTDAHDHLKPRGHAAPDSHATPDAPSGGSTRSGHKDPDHYRTGPAWRHTDRQGWSDIDRSHARDISPPPCHDAGPPAWRNPDRPHSGPPHSGPPHSGGAGPPRSDDAETYRGSASAGYVGDDPNAKLAAILRDALTSLPPLLGGRSAILDAGRSTPTFTAPIRDALRARYGGRCSFRLCDQRATVIHHIVHWARGGRTSVGNAAPLCEYHHYLVHEGGWHLLKDRSDRIVAVPPPPNWPGPHRRWRNGQPVEGVPAT